MPDQKDRDWFDATRSGWSSDEVVAELRRKVFGPACQVLIDARDSQERQPDKKVEPQPGQAQTRRQGPEMDR